MNWTTWHAHFAQRAQRPLPSHIDLPDLDRATCEHLVRTFAVFQRGETGEGRVIQQVRKMKNADLDATYQQALTLFVAEEGRHSALLGRMLRAMGGKPLKHAWSDQLFRRARGNVRVQDKLLILLSAEVVAGVFYKAIADALPKGQMRDTIHEIVADEQHHLQFHIDFFRTVLHTPAQLAAFRAQWWAVASASCATVMWDHRHTLKALGIRRRDLVLHIAQMLKDVNDGVAEPIIDQASPAETLAA